MRLALLLVLSVTLIGAAATPTPVNFSKDVMPILQRNCQGCHRPGEAAPMPLLSYQQARPWAKAIKEAVRVKRMPPWFADAAHGKFANDRSLSQNEIDTLIAWADAGAPEGNPKDLPKPVEFVEGWNIGRPDAVFEMPNDFAVSERGTIEYQYVVIPTNFTEDRWVKMAEVRPGTRSVVHHVIAFVRPPGSSWLKDAQPGVPFVPQRGRRAEGRNTEGGDGLADVELLVGYAPGLPEVRLESGQAKLIRAGSDLVFQLHYTTNGKASADRTKIGVVFAKEPPRQRIYTTSAATNSRFVIPPGAANHQVEAQATFQLPATLVWMMPHMHLRGKDFEYRAVYPTGEKEVLLRVPKYDFNWQLGYRLSDPLPIPAGTRIECTAHFDNSPNNAANPDASKEVKWGDQSWEEMMIGWMDLAIDPSINARDIFRAKKPAAPSGSE